MEGSGLTEEESDRIEETNVGAKPNGGSEEGAI